MGARGALLKQGTNLLIVGPKGLKRFPRATFLRALTCAEAQGTYGLRLPKTSTALVLRHG